MKLVASAKLHKAQMAIENMLPYNERLTGIVNDLLNSESLTGTFRSSLMEKREVKRVALVTISSSASLCGGFNNNLIRLTQHVIDEYREQNTDILLIPIGRKVAQALAVDKEEPDKLARPSGRVSSSARQPANLSTESAYVSIGEKPTHAEASALATYLTKLYLNKEIDRVELLYTHYKNMAVQVLMREQFLPVEVDKLTKPSALSPSSTRQSVNSSTETDYLIEPSAPELLNRLLPQVLDMHMFTMLLDSSAAEHAARTFAMQQATDNGEGLLQELSLQYNKGRQQAITNELLDIMGGTLR